MHGQCIGYIRVSSVRQDIERQLEGQSYKQFLNNSSRPKYLRPVKHKHLQKYYFYGSIFL
jgi:hypothetical protein